MFCFSELESQNTYIDSLKRELDHPIHDTTRTNLYLQIAEGYEGINIDSLFFYAEKAKSLCESYIPANIDDVVMDPFIRAFVKNKGLVLYLIGDNMKNRGEFTEAQEYFYESIEWLGFIDMQAEAAANYTPLGICQFALGNYERAIEYFEKSLDAFRKLDNQKNVAAAYVNIGVIYRHQGLYDMAIENYMESLRIFEELEELEGVGKAYLNIGVIHNYQENYDLAIDYYRNALEIFEELENDRDLLRLYNNIGIIYNKMGNDEEDVKAKIEYYDEALDYFKNSLSLSKKLDDKLAISAALSNIGSIYNDMDLYNEALKHLTEALEIDKEIGDRGGMASIYSSMSSAHLHLADSLKNKQDEQSISLMQEHIEKSFNYGHLSYDMAEEIGSLPTQRSAARVLTDVYKYIGNYGEAINFAEKYIKLNEVLYNEERARALTEMQTKYEAEKKELEIENLNKERELRIAELARSEEQRKKQRIVIYSFIAGFIIIAVFLFIIIRLFIQKKKANTLLANQKDQIEQQNFLLNEANEEIKSQKEELETHHELVVQQKDFIEKQKFRIDDSILYAKRIQTAALPTDDFIDSLLDEYFILFKPKDVVSGDFYWAGSEGDWTVVIAADCTGHGVPGALMSMLGISFINQIISKKGVTDAAMVLNELREAVIKALKQSPSFDSQVDGMDISLAVINKKTYKCHWAGAYNPLWIIRKNAVAKNKEDKSEIIEEIKGDRMPISLYHTMNKFKNHEIQLEKGDKLYLYSDGFVDQFGGMQKKKFSRKAFKKLIANTSSLPMKEQGVELERTLVKWMNTNDSDSYEQIDDIVVFGLMI